MGKDTQQKTASVIREFSSGGIVFKKTNSQTLWLVAASMPSEIYPEVVWRLPKGWIDDESLGIPGPMASGKVKADEQSLQKAALREVNEEGGVEARIIQKVGTEKYFFDARDRGKILKFVTFYLMEWVRDLSEGFDGETSQIKWLTFDDAIKTLTFSGEKQMIKKANELLLSET